MEKVISYLIPSFNHEPYVIGLLDSIKKDSESFNGNAEIVIFDDGSSDRSPELIRQWEAEHKSNVDIVAMYSEKNGGIPFALNRLIEMSSGEYVRLCATDDLIIPGSTKLMIERFARQPQLICIFGDATVIDENDAVIHESSIAYHHADAAKLQNQHLLPRELVENWCIAGPSMVIRRSHYENMRYDESLKIDDFDLVLSLLEKKNSISFINGIVGKYRIHQTNTSKTKNVEKRIQNLGSFLAIVNRYVERGNLKELLLPLKYKTMAKLDFLQKKYILCGAHMMHSAYLKSKVKNVK